VKLFVTGGTGFIGSHFLRQAHQRGHQIVALRRSPTSVCRVEIIHEPEWVDASMDDVPVEKLNGCNVIVHLAAHSVNVPYDTLENCIRWNVLAPAMLFRRAIEVGITRYVVAGSCFEYGRSGERYDYIPPDAPLEPTQTYPASKAAASVTLSQMAIENNLQLSIHRIFQVYGEGEAENRLWPSLMKAAKEGRDFNLTPAEQIRDFIPVEKVAQKLIDACEREVQFGTPYIENLGTGLPQSLRDFVIKCWTEWGASGQLIFGAQAYRRGEVMRYVPLITNPLT
jgi:nucleoside-diphosphate-sugar epimerase